MQWNFAINTTRITHNKHTIKHIIMQLKKYILWLSHDKGKTRVSMYATSQKSAIECLMEMEGCPRNAISTPAKRKPQQVRKSSDGIWLI